MPARLQRRNRLTSRFFLFDSCINFDNLYTVTPLHLIVSKRIKRTLPLEINLSTLSVDAQCQDIRSYVLEFAFVHGLLPINGLIWGEDRDYRALKSVIWSYDRTQAQVPTHNSR